MAKYSVALTVYNGEKFLKNQLQSLVHQTILPDELVVCDDRSTNDSVSVLEKFAGKAPFPVRILVNDTNLGYSQNFNRVLHSVSGDYVFPCDQDDVWFPEKVEKMIQFMEVNPKTQVAIHDLEYCKADLTPIGQTKIERMRESFDLNRSYVVGMATVVRREFLKHCLPVPRVDGVAFDDWIHRCAAFVDVKEVKREVLAFYRRHSSNTTGSGSLNVDFVTTPRHFKKRRWKNVRIKTPSYSSGTVFLDWVEREWNFLGRIVGSEELKQRYKSIHQENELRQARELVWSKPRWKRIQPVLRHWRNGGYRLASGWRSAAKDLLVN